MKRITLPFLLLSLILLSSCDKPSCENKNPIYIDNPIISKAYNDELVKDLSTSKNLSFWLKEVIYESDKDFLLVSINNEKICTVGRFLVTDWSSIEGIKKTKGVGYRGAQLKGFSYSIIQTKTETVLHFKSLSAILD